MNCVVCGKIADQNWCGYSCLFFGCNVTTPDSYAMYAPFRVFLSRAKRRGKKFALTLADLKNQWDRQNGICPYTGWSLILPKTSNERPKKTIDRASLDRIDSSRGYTKDNIQWVSLAIQYAKHTWTNEELKIVFEAVVKNGNLAKIGKN